MYDHSERSHVAWDIETTGFGWSEEVTVSGFWFPDGHATLVVNAGPHSANERALADRLTEASRSPVSVRVADDERSLLQETCRVVFDQFDRDYNRLVAYNAESWQGGFDLPFVRTRCIRQGVDWLFDGVVFADLWEPVEKRLNTTVTAHGASDSANSLSGAYGLLFDRNDDLPGLSDARDDHAWYRDAPYDPFEDSGSAVAQYREGDLTALCLHNLADVHRTWELGELLREFVPAKDVTGKKL